MSSFYLTDDQSNPTKWALPARTLADGAFLVLWLDGETGEGDTHASFRPAASGGSLHLYAGVGGVTTLIDSVTYPALAAGRSLARLGEYSGATWAVTTKATGGAANEVIAGAVIAAGSESLRVNEVMANNDHTIEDPDEAGAYEDWIEIYNPGAAAVDMSGMYLTDDLTKPTKWQVPSGVTIAAEGDLLFWADNETGQGSRHTNFKLAAEGEAVGLVQPDGVTVVDSVTFGAQALDAAYGRHPDGSGAWTVTSPPTPGAANRVASLATTSYWVPVASHAAGASSSQWRTDLGVLNPGDAVANVELRFHAAGGVVSSATSVGAGVQSILADVVGQLGGTGTAALEVLSDQAVVVTSRTYNLVSDTAACSAGGTLGQDYASFAAGEGLAAGQSAWLGQLTENAQYRTNITLTNTGSAAARAIITLYDGSGAQVGSYAVDLAAGEWKQENRPFAAKAGQSSLVRGYAKVTVTAGSGVLAHASVVDNVTNDPTTVPALRQE